MKVVWQNLLYRILCKGKTKERVSLTMCCRHGPSSERVKRIRHLFIICCMEAKGLLFFCKFFFPKRFWNVDVDADAISFSVDKSCAMIHCDEGVNTCCNVFSCRDASFFNRSDNSTRVVLMFVKMLKWSWIPPLFHSMRLASDYHSLLAFATSYKKLFLKNKIF